VAVLIRAPSIMRRTGCVPVREATLRTSNATAVTEVRSASFGLVTEYRHYNARHVAISSSVVYRALSLRYVCIRSPGIIFTPRLPLCQISFLSRPPLLS